MTTPEPRLQRHFFADDVSGVRSGTAFCSVLFLDREGEVGTTPEFGPASSRPEVPPAPTRSHLYPTACKMMAQTFEPKSLLFDILLGSRQLAGFNRLHEPQDP